jgi:hypothetical protein
MHGAAVILEQGSNHTSHCTDTASINQCGTAARDIICLCLSHNSQPHCQPHTPHITT